MEKKHIELANWQIVLIALYRVGAHERPVDVEDAFFEAHQLAPSRFSWRTRKNLPDTAVLSKALRDIEKQGGKGFFHGSTSNRQLTSDGVKWIQDHMLEVESLEAPETVLGQSKSSEGYVLLRRVENSTELQKWCADETYIPEKWKLADVFKCSPDSPIRVWNTRINQADVAAYSEGNTSVQSFLKLAKEVISDE